MKNILSILFVSLLVSCGSQVSDLELRVAKLETEIASMRKGGKSIVLLEHFQNLLLIRRAQLRRYKRW